MTNQYTSNTIFDIKSSEKSCIACKEQFIVAYNNNVYLRIVGEEGGYTVMTATASEDDGKIAAFPDQESLINAAINVSANGEVTPIIKQDHFGRPYAEICKCEYLSDAHRIAEELFGNLKKCLQKQR